MVPSDREIVELWKAAGLIQLEITKLKEQRDAILRQIPATETSGYQVCVRRKRRVSVANTEAKK